MGNLLFTNVELYDGTGKPPCHADVAVQDDKIVTVAPSGTLNRTGSTVVDGGGKALVPGFVDVHTHSDAATYRVPGADSKIALMSINEHDGRDYLFPASGKGIRYICRVVQSIRNEDDLDSAMSATGLHHQWEKKLDKLNGK